MTAPKDPTQFELVTDLATVVEALTRADVAARTRDQRDQLTPLGRMYADAPGLRAAAYDAERGGTQHWCETHECEISRCRRWGRDCTGVPLSGPSDPTGEAAVAVTPGLTSVRVLTNALAVIRDATVEILDELRTWSLMDAEAAKALTDGQDEDANAKAERVCFCCSRAGGRPPNHTPKGDKPTTVDGRLDEPRDLCAWCQKFVRATLQMPSPVVSEAHVGKAKLHWRQRGDAWEIVTTSGILVDRIAVQRHDVEDVA